MGSLKEKLQYLKESISIVKDAYGYDWIDYISADGLPTLRKRMEFLRACAIPLSNAASDPYAWANGVQAPFDITLADGTVKKVNAPTDLLAILPPMQIHDSQASINLPIGSSGSIANKPLYVDLSAPKVAEGASLNVDFKFFEKTPVSLILNDRQRLEGAMLQGAGTSIFTNGLKFGKCVVSCASNWIGTVYNWHGNEIFVSVPEGFEGTVYLSKLPIKAECLVGIINNLADMSGTETVYELNIGPTNMEKLTAEQIEIATTKGWIVS